MMSLRPALAAKLKASTSVHQTARAFGAYWNKDWRPKSEVPKTAEEKAAAAKKYGLIPSDYRTYPDDGTGYGDYPKLPPIGAESRDPQALYDFPELKRNYGEPLHVDADLYGEDRWNVSQKLRVPLRRMVLWYVGVMTGLFATFQIFQHVRLVPLRQMPPDLHNDGRKHYSFELVEKD